MRQLIDLRRNRTDTKCSVAALSAADCRAFVFACLVIPPNS
jgi:hypothetical protein